MFPNRPPSMTEAERQKISAFIEARFGIKMPAAKKTLLEGRLAKRVAACKLPSYGAYFDFVVKDPAGRDEYLFFEDLVSTHETSFFREAHHFQFLEQTALPALWSREPRQDLSVLSAACSTGEEAYTLGMVIDQALSSHGPKSLSFTVEGVDMSSHVVAIAERGVYLTDRTKAIPQTLKHRYLMESKDKLKKVCRFVPELRQKMTFHTGNLLASLELTQPAYDLIFCRNVLIYFDKDNQRRVLTTLLNHLRPQGYLFLGHAESMIGLQLSVKSVAQAVFQKI